MASTSNFKPTGYNSLSPYMVVDEAHKMIVLLEAIFGAKALRQFDRPNGSIQHIELQIDDSILMLSEATPTYPPNQFLLHVYVPDVHATFEKAIALGCEAIEVPTNKADDPDTRGMFKDFAGNVWAVGTQMG